MSASIVGCSPLDTLKPFVMDCNHQIQMDLKRFHVGTRREFVEEVLFLVVIEIGSAQVDKWLDYVPGQSRADIAPFISSRVFVIFGGPGEGKSALFAHLYDTFRDDVVAVHACKFSYQLSTVPRRIVLWLVLQVLRSVFSELFLFRWLNGLRVIVRSY